MGRGAVYAVPRSPTSWAAESDDLVRSKRPVMVEPRQPRPLGAFGGRSPLAALQAAQSAAGDTASVLLGGSAGWVLGPGALRRAKAKGFKRRAQDATLPPVLSSSAPPVLPAGSGQFTESGVAADLQSDVQSQRGRQPGPRNTYAKGYVGADPRGPGPLSTKQMKSLFRDLVSQHQAAAPSQRLDHWLPALLRDTWAATEGQPSPHPVRAAVALFAVERMIDYHQLQFGRELRRELVGAIYAGGLAMDEVMPRGVGSGILDRLLQAEVADAATIRANKVGTEAQALAEAHEETCEQLERRYESAASSLRRVAFRAWRSVLDNHWPQALQRVKEKQADGRTVGAAFRQWRGWVWAKNRAQAKTAHDKALRETRENATRDYGAMQASYDAQVLELKARVQELEDQVNAKAGIDVAKGEEFDSMSKRCRDLEAKVKQLQKQIEEHREKNVLHSLDAEVLREHLDKAANYMQNAHKLSIGSDVRTGVRAVDLVHAAINPEHDMRQPLPEVLDAEADELISLGKARPQDVLLVWVNHVVRITDANSRVVRNWTSDLADGEVFITMVHQLWPEAAGVLDLRNEHSLPDRVGGLCNHLRNLLRGDDLKWLRREAILGQREEVNLMLASVLFERYCDTHCQIRPVRCPDVSALKPEQLDDHLAAADEAFRKGMANRQSLGLVQRSVRHFLSGLLQQMAEEGVRKRTIQDRRGSDEAARHGWAELRDEKIQAAAPTASSADCDDIRDILLEHAERLRQVYQYYGNVRHAMQGILSEEWLRLCSDAGFGRTLQGRTRLDQFYTVTMQTRGPGPKGASMADLALLLIRIADDTDGELLPLRPQDVGSGDFAGGRRRSRRGSVAASPRAAGPPATIGARLQQVCVELAKVQHADIDAFRELYRAQENQLVMMNHNRALLSVYEWFAKRDEQKRGNNTTLNVDEWTRMLKELDCIDAQLGVKDAVLLFNASQDVECASPASELSFREFLEALFGIALCRVPIAILPVWCRVNNFFQERLLPCIRRKFPQVKLAPPPGSGGGSDQPPGRRGTLRAVDLAMLSSEPSPVRANSGLHSGLLSSRKGSEPNMSPNRRQSGIVSFAPAGTLQAEDQDPQSQSMSFGRSPRRGSRHVGT
eukprot:TRINITY_DN70311_c0_g1_i1.p1 TRINITY_DN70311_c0_g1~~TRINITY_DN70311_c0_g1_i1.p1  ORF type:complete len:1148 (+),score=371.85 TRINITY_DN70311_c0_g1_i1:87-3446(+)